MKIKKENAVKGYKVTNNKLMCRDFTYEIGKVFKEDHVDMCRSGFHFCIEAVDCFNYYSFDSNNRVFEVIGWGEVDEGKDKTVCSDIKFLKEIKWDEVLKIVNTGKNNTGHTNSGDWNSGDWNSGNRNSGNSNSGDWNSGNSNSGDSNSGNSNSGDSNSGNSNSGDRNSGNSNSGDWNSGDRNSGHWNSGYWNSGHWNSGYWNSGNSNSGDWNSGDRNSGHWNSGDRNSGFFNSKEPENILIFNKECLKEDWDNAKKPNFIYNINVVEWIYFSNMSDEEKKNNKDAYVTDGYLKKYTYKDAWINAYKNASEKDIELLKNLPNFDSKVFKEITGIKI